ncbi:Vacuolar amino acid transporter 2 [Diplonema papillatum]|nr:Vacuolar amino acid transporter 2 [Diplonema papillatum]
MERLPSLARHADLNLRGGSQGSPALGIDSPTFSEHAEDPAPKNAAGMNASVWASALNLINNIVGAGLFSMPWTMKRASVAGGVAICTATCLLNTVSYLLLARCCDLSSSFTYLDIGKKAFGRRFGVAAQTCVLLYSLGSCLSFVVLLGDFLAGDSGVFRAPRAAVVYGVAALVFGPLACLRNTEGLKWTSLVSFVSCFGAAALVVGAAVHRPAAAFAGRELGPPKVVLAELSSRAWAAVPVINVAFTAHYNAPRFYQELRDRSLGRFNLVVGFAMAFALCLYVAVGASGYATFGEETQGSILVNYSPTWSAAVAARAFLAAVVAFTFPLANHAARESIFSLASNGRVSTNTVSKPAFAATSVLLVVATTVVGAHCEKIEKILAFKGALFGTCLVYIIPPLMYAQLLRLKLLEDETRALLLSELAPMPDDSDTTFSQRASPPPAEAPARGSMRVAVALLILLPLWGVATCVMSLCSLFGVSFFTQAPAPA